MCDWASFKNPSGHWVRRFLSYCQSRDCVTSPQYDEARYGPIQGKRFEITIGATIVIQPSSPTANQLTARRQTLQKRNQMLSSINFDNSGASGPPRLDVIHSVGFNWGDITSDALGKHSAIPPVKTEGESSPPRNKGKFLHTSASAIAKLPAFPLSSRCMRPAYSETSRDDYPTLPASGRTNNHNIASTSRGKGKRITVSTSSQGKRPDFSSSSQGNLSAPSSSGQGGEPSSSNSRQGTNLSFPTSGQGITRPSPVSGQASRSSFPTSGQRAHVSLPTSTQGVGPSVPESGQRNRPSSSRSGQGNRPDSSSERKRKRDQLPPKGKPSGWGSCAVQRELSERERYSVLKVEVSFFLVVWASALESSMFPSLQEPTTQQEPSTCEHTAKR